MESREKCKIDKQAWAKPGDDTLVGDTKKFQELCSLKICPLESTLIIDHGDFIKFTKFPVGSVRNPSSDDVNSITCFSKRRS